MIKVMTSNKIFEIFKPSNVQCHTDLVPPPPPKLHYPSNQKLEKLTVSQQAGHKINVIGISIANRHLYETTIVGNSPVLLYRTTSHVLCFFASNVGLKGMFILSTFTPHLALVVTTYFKIAMFFDQIVLWPLVYQN